MLNALRKELETLREACKVGAVLSRRIDDGSGRLRHADEIIDGMLKMLDKAPPTGDIPAFYNLRIGTIQRAPDGFIEFMHVYDGNNQHAQTVYRDPKPRQFWNENDRLMHAQTVLREVLEWINPSGTIEHAYLPVWLARKARAALFVKGSNNAELRK